MGGVSGGDELCVSQWYYGEEEKRDIWWKYKKISVGEFEFCSETQSVLNYFFTTPFRYLLLLLSRG